MIHLITRIRSRIASAIHQHNMRSQCQAQPSTRFVNTSRVLNNRRPQAIKIGRETVVAGELLVYGDSGQIAIGDCCYIGADTRIWAADQVSIGHRVLISHNVNIHDSIAHSLSAQERHEHFNQIFKERRSHIGSVPRKPIVIEDDVWIGFNATLLRGIRVGRGAVIAAGAIITKDVPPFTIMAGPTASHIGRSFE